VVCSPRPKISSSSSSAVTTGLADDFINTLSYPREITISSTPIKTVKEESARLNKLNLNGKENAVKKGVGKKNEHSHVNLGYDLTLKNEIATSEPPPAVRQQQHQQLRPCVSVGVPVLAAAAPHTSHVETRKASFSIQNLNELIRNSIRENRVLNLKRESSQLLPHSIERQMARNFQNIKATTTAVPVAVKYPDVSVNSSSLETSIENNNHISKYTDSTSLPSNSAELSLKDEDAWLPILNIAEEQVDCD
jgi:hypothetical protein